MYNGKFENKNAAEKKTVFRYWPLVFIVLISITIVLLGYWLCMIAVGGIKGLYVFMVENIDSFSISTEVFVVFAVIGLLIGFAILMKKFYIGEWVNYYPSDDEVENPMIKKPVGPVKSSKSKNEKSRGKHQDHKSTASYEVSPGEVVWTPTEPSKRYGYKF